jgi:hypothetical protein
MRVLLSNVTPNKRQLLTRVSCISLTHNDCMVEFAVSNFHKSRTGGLKDHGIHLNGLPADSPCSCVHSDEEKRE